MPLKDKQQNPPQHCPRSKCAIANGLEILGDRWTLLIIRDLLFTNRNEFGHLLKSGEGISTNILTERLERLQCYGVIEKLPHPNHGRKFIYQLTDKGRGLAPVLIEFANWSKEALAGAFIPPPLDEMIQKDKKGLIQRVKKGETLFHLDLD